MLVTTLYPDTQAKILPIPAGDGDRLAPVYLLWAANRLATSKRGATCGISAPADQWKVNRHVAASPPVYAPQEHVLVPAYVLRLTPTDGEPGPITLRWTVNHRGPESGQLLTVEFRPDGFALSVIPAAEFRAGRNAPPATARPRDVRR